MKKKGTPNQIDIHVGQRLRVRRSLMGFSQEKLAEAIGITFQQVQKYEKGTNRVSAGRLYQIAGFLDTTVTFFFEGLEGKEKKIAGFADNEQEPFGEEDIMQKKETIDLVKAYYSVDEKKRKNILKFIKSMSDE